MSQGWFTKGLDKGYYKSIPNKLDQMTNTATLRPTAAQIQRNQARADRKAAAAERRAERTANVETVTQQYVRMYANIGR